MIMKHPLRTGNETADCAALLSAALGLSPGKAQVIARRGLTLSWSLNRAIAKAPSVCEIAARLGAFKIELGYFESVIKQRPTVIVGPLIPETFSLFGLCDALAVEEAPASLGFDSMSKPKVSITPVHSLLNAKEATPVSLFESRMGTPSELDSTFESIALSRGFQLVGIDAELRPWVTEARAGETLSPATLLLDKQRLLGLHNQHAKRWPHRMLSYFRAGFGLSNESVLRYFEVPALAEAVSRLLSKEAIK